MPSRLRSRDRRASSAALLAVACLGSGCASGGEPGLRVGKGETDVVFGLPAPAPVSAEAPVDTRPGAPVDDEEAWYFDDTTPPVSRPRGRPSPPRERCPQAALTAFPATAAPATVVGTPATGTYFWHQSGAVQAQANGPTRTLAGMQRRVVGGVRSESENVFSFQVVYPPADTPRATRTTYRVKLAADGRTDRVDPPGLTIAAIEYFDERGEEVADRRFTPTPGVMLLRLPVVSNGTFTSRSVATSVGLVEVTGRVKTRKRVDACGELVDGWDVTAQHKYTDASGKVTTHAYDYIVAPHFGGMIIAERKEFTNEAGGKVSASFSIAQTKPTGG